MKAKDIVIDTHRGKEDTSFGKHSRVPFQLSNIDASSLLVLALIDIDQFLDSDYKLGRERRVITLTTFTELLGLSVNTVRKCLKNLEAKEIITSNYKAKKGTSYISNLLKLKIKYQIITYSFITRNDLSFSLKAFILKVIMLGDRRITNIRNVTALVKEVGMTRRAVNAMLEELNDRGYILNSDKSGVYILDVSGVMLDSEERLMLEHRDLRAQVAVYKKFVSFEEEIEKLNLQIVNLNKKIERLKNGKS